jgi:succinoglycan biosynthesis transport protein ExoP
LLALHRRPAQAGSMFASPQMTRLLEILRDACDLVVLDCGPALAGPDAALIARHAEVTVLVLRREKLRARSVVNATQMLENAYAAPVGLMIAG